MRALLSHQPGPPSSLQIADIADPTAGPGEAVVRVEAAALNFLDTLVIADRYQYKPARPFSPGSEMAGIVESVADDVVGVKPGDRVMAFFREGCCRERIALAASQLIPVPDAVPSDIAAGLIVTYATSLYALRDRAQLAPGETLAVLGAAGGTGQAAVEIGKLMGARVIACASSDDKLAFTRAVGADETINYATEDLKERLKALSGGGVDVLYDPVGGDLAEPAVRSMGWCGRYLVIGFAGGTIPRIPLNLLLLKSCDIRGVFWGESAVRDPAGHHRNVEQLLAWVAEGKLRPHIDGRYSLEDAPQALERIAARQVKGKVVIMP